MEQPPKSDVISLPAEFQCCVGIRSCFVLKDGLDSSHGSFISSFPQPVGVGALRDGGLFAAKLFAP
jgi:hypothetical protein